MSLIRGLAHFTWGVASFFCPFYFYWNLAFSKIPTAFLMISDTRPRYKYNIGFRFKNKSLILLRQYSEATVDPCPLHGCMHHFYIKSLNKGSLSYNRIQPAAQHHHCRNPSRNKPKSSYTNHCLTLHCILLCPEEILQLGALYYPYLYGISQCFLIRESAIIYLAADFISQYDGFIISTMLPIFLAIILKYAFQCISNICHLNPLI